MKKTLYSLSFITSMVLTVGLLGTHKAQACTLSEVEPNGFCADMTRPTDSPANADTSGNTSSNTGTDNTVTNGGTDNTITNGGNDNTVTNNGTDNTVTNGGTDNTVTNGGSAFGFSLENPLKAKSVQCLLYYIINGVMSLLGVIAGLYVIYSGFLFIKAQGDPKKLTEAKTAFLNAIIGTAILLGAWAITTFIVTVVNEITAQPVAGLPTATSCQT